ncbi:MAG: HAMP domain-containing sensor histidine kinase [Chitinophagaceae bacterium]
MTEISNTRRRQHASGSSKTDLRWPVISMLLAIIAITGFQVYWMKNNYEREKQNLDIKTSAAFRQTVLRLQSSKLKLEKFDFQSDTLNTSGVTVRNRKGGFRPLNRLRVRKEPSITLLNLLQERMKDSLGNHLDSSNVPIIALRRPHRGGHELTDSMRRRMKVTIRSFDIEHSIDSVLDPQMIRDVRVSRDGNTKGGVIAIGYSKNDSNYKSKERKGFENNAEFFINDNLPPANAEDVLVPGKNNLLRTSNNVMYRFLYNIDSLSIIDSITVNELREAYANRLKEDDISVGFKVARLDSTQTDLPNAVTIGLTKPATFGFSLQNTFVYMLDKLKLPILFSLLLLGITIFSFVLLYRNMIRQQRLADLKNEFISNITHELKTPIATVGVAIEALKNFNALDDPRRTKEYLDISQNELQRLNLLVDKVLKLSIFEQKAIELKKETFDLKQLAKEIMNSMKLQFEKYGSKVSLNTEGDNFLIEADKLHITSVVYNLLDNALKYSKENPAIDVLLKTYPQHISLSVKDNGIGIPPEYKRKVFEKFFRVPTGDKHNIKGYGLGLSYVSEIAARHHGFITVESELGKGSVFTVNIPYKEAAVIQFDEHRKISKKK